MKKLEKILHVLSLALILVCAAAVSACAVTEGPESDSSAEASASASEPSLATTSPAVCEILDALEYDNVIGVPTTDTDLPERYADATEIGAPMTPDIEIVAQLNPDYIISPKTLEEDLSSEYATAGISSIFLDLSSVDGMYTAIDSLGVLLDREEQAAALREEYEEYMASYAAEEEDNPTVLILMCYPDGFFLVCTEDCYVGNLVELAGGINVYEDEAEDGFISINPEDMVQRDPDKILVYAHYSEEAAFAYMEEEFETNSAWSYFSAVQNGEIYYLPSEYFSMSCNLEWTESLDYLEPILYGED